MSQCEQHRHNSSHHEQNLKICLGKHTGSWVPAEILLLSFCYSSESLDLGKQTSFSSLPHPLQPGSHHAHFKETALPKVIDDVFIAKSSILSTEIWLMHLMTLDTACCFSWKHTNSVSMTLYAPAFLSAKHRCLSSFLASNPVNANTPSNQYLAPWHCLLFSTDGEPFATIYYMLIPLKLVFLIPNGTHILHIFHWPFLGVNHTVISNSAFE